MSDESRVAVAKLVDRSPTLVGSEIVDHLIPPRQFSLSTLESYVPDRDYPSQGAAVAAIRNFVAEWRRPASGLFARRNRATEAPGIYFDGGFGVGKTHLLAALWHLAPSTKYFGSFIEYTALVGALGYAKAVKALTGASLICIDEFELDDPGDTRLMSRLLSELVASGSRIAATSNTPPNSLGEGRFAAQDFLREIDSLAAKFTTLRIDGLDYRHRDPDAHALVTGDVPETLASVAGSTTLDRFDDVLAHLASIHPSRYPKLVDGLNAIGLIDVHPFANQTDALRFVALVDRLYDAQVRIVSSGTPLDAVFGAEMLAGGYRKKYLRAISRLIALTNDTV